MEQNHIALFPIVRVHKLLGLNQGQSSRGQNRAKEGIG